MIVAERKPLEEVLSLVRDCKKVLVAGCGTCVAVCLAGGEKEAGILTNEIRLASKARGKSIAVDTVTLERQCDMEFLDEIQDRVKDYDAIVSLACGAGIQFMAERYEETPVLPGVDTTFIGANRDVGWYEEKCRACGTCVLGITAGICPVTMCAKSLFNGPCGGTNMGSCEINTDQPCAWHRIHERLAKQGRLDNIIEFRPANEWKNQIPRTIVQPTYKDRYAK